MNIRSYAHTVLITLIAAVYLGASCEKISTQMTTADDDS